MYTIDLATLLQLLEEFHKSGILRTEIPSGLPGFKQRCLVVIELKNGQIVACSVKDKKENTLLADQVALQAISAVGKLNWIFEDAPAQEVRQQSPVVPPLRTASPPTSPFQQKTSQPFSSLLPNAQERRDSSNTSLVPYRLVNLSNSEMSRWSRRYRQVYVLIDGVRTIDKIATMLSLTSQEVESALKMLQSTGTVVLKKMD